MVNTLRNKKTGQFKAKKLTIQEILAKSSKELEKYMHPFNEYDDDDDYGKVNWESGYFQEKEFTMYCFNCSDFYMHNGDGICPKCKK